MFAVKWHEAPVEQIRSAIETLEHWAGPEPTVQEGLMFMLPLFPNPAHSYTRMNFALLYAYQFGDWHKVLGRCIMIEALQCILRGKMTPYTPRKYPTEPRPTPTLDSIL